MRISETYRYLNKMLHQERTTFGSNGHRWARHVAEIANQIAADSILDYGAGKGTLAKAFGTGAIRQYDPCVPGLDKEPEPADLVVSTDVLEHIEPECLNDVLDHIKSLATKAVFLVVATRPAVKTLPDGRNAHLIMESSEWWLPQLWKRWRIGNFQDAGHEFLVVGFPKSAGDVESRRRTSTAVFPQRSPR